MIRRVINPQKAMLRLTQLNREYQKAIKRHKPRKDIEREMVSIRTGLIQWANRRDAA